MKKTLFIMLILGVMAAGLCAESLESNLYFKSYPLSVVNVSSEGYRLIYMKSDMSYHVFYCPMDWFRGTDGKGEILYGSGPVFPYFTVFWEDGQFSHIKLYLHQDRHHSSWRDLPLGRDYSDKFNVSEPQLAF